MQIEGRAGIQEHTRQDSHPGKGHQIDRQAKPQRQTGQGNDDKDLQAEEEHHGRLAGIVRTEDRQINHKQTQEQYHQNRLAQEREFLLLIACILIFVCTIEGLQHLVGTLVNDLALLDDSFILLHHTYGRRERS